MMSLLTSSGHADVAARWGRHCRHRSASGGLFQREALAAVLGADAGVAQAVLVAVQVRLRLGREVADCLAVRTMESHGRELVSARP